MAGSDTHIPSRRWRSVLTGAAVLATGLVMLQVGLPAAAEAGPGNGELRARVLHGHQLLSDAVEDYVRDLRALPVPSFDLSAGVPNALSDLRLAPFREQEAWRGPYLPAGLPRPTPASFWSLADPQALGPIGAEGPAAAWGRLHRGYGEIDDALTQSVDEALDDGDPNRGAVQVTDTWLWFRLAELPSGRPAR